MSQEQHQHASNIIGIMVAKALSLLSVSTAPKNFRLNIALNNTDKHHTTDVSVHDLTRVFPGEEYQKLPTYAQAYIEERTTAIKPLRIVTIKEAPELGTSFGIELWELDSDENHALVNRYQDVALLAIGAWYQPLMDFVNGAEIEDIKFPALITQYLSGEPDSFHDDRGLDFVVPGSDTKPVPALKAVFDPKLDTNTHNPFSRLFRVMVRQSLVKAPQWNKMMDAYVSATEDKLREKLRAHLNLRFTAEDMTWEEFKQGMAFLKIGLGDDGISEEDVIDARVCMFDAKLHVLAKRAA